DSIEPRIDRPGQVDVPGRGDFPVVEACNELKRGRGEDDVSRRDDVTCVSANVDHGGVVRISIFNLERRGRVSEEIREGHVEDLLMNGDLRTLRVSGVLVPAS